MARVGANDLWALIILVLMATLNSLALASSRYDPALQWYTVRSEHFNVHFHTGEESWAPLVLATAEQAHAKLTKEMRWAPLGVTDIVLADKFDLSNGGTQVFPSLHIELYMVLPNNLELIDRGDWLQKLIEHEYAHVLHLDMARGRVRDTRETFGRLPFLFPNMLQPFWGIEGIATFYETDKAQGIGRGQSSMFRMMMRTEVMEGIKPLYQINQDVSTWPGGTVRYLYGVEFFKFVEEKYGREKVEELMREYSDNLLPFFVNYNARQVLGKRLTALWPEFEAWVKTRYNLDIQATEQQGVIKEGRAVTHYGGDTGSPRVLPNGQLYFIREDNAITPVLMQHDASNGDIALAHLLSGAMFDVHEKSGFIIAQPEFCRDVNLYFDLYALPLSGGEPKRLTHCARLRDPAWHPSGNSIVAVRAEGLRNDLVLLSRSGGEERVLWQGETGVLVHRPAWSPDGKYIAATRWRRDSGVQIEEFSLATQTWKTVTHGSALHFHPSYSTDGDLYYSADEDGIFNIYRRRANEAGTEQLTRVLSGAFMPVPAENGELVYQGYGALGYDIYHLPSSTVLQQAVEQDKKYAPLARTLDVIPVEKTAYTPWPGLRPHWWVPHLSLETGGTEWGITTSGADPLYRHSYYVDIAYAMRTDSPVGTLTYTYDRFKPQIQLRAINAHQTFTQDVSSWEVRQFSQAQADIYWQWRMRERRFLIAGSAGMQENTSLVRNNIVPNPDAKDASVGVSMSFDTLRAYARSHTPESGYSFAIAANGIRHQEKGAFTNTGFGRASFAQYFPMRGGNNLSIALTVGRQTSLAMPLWLGGKNNDIQNTRRQTVLWLNQRNFALKGYEFVNTDANGSAVATGGVEWRLPLGFVERGFMTPPVALQKVYGAFYLDTGKVWHGQNPSEPYLSTAGAELNASFHLFYSFVPLWARVRYAYYMPQNRHAITYSVEWLASF